LKRTALLGFSGFVLLCLVLLALTRFGTNHTDNTPVPPDLGVDLPIPPEVDSLNSDFDSNTDNSDMSGDKITDSDLDSNLQDLDTDTSQTHGTKSLEEMTASELVADIRIGWSLGNTLDAHNGAKGFANLGGGIYANTSVTELETGWGRPVTTAEHINAVKDAGFNAIRIPVTWFKACDDELNIREDWMLRVKEVIDYAAVNDLYIILNTHHDEMLYGLLDTTVEASKVAMDKIWTQIATVFRDYDEKLFFEGLGEPRTAGSPAEWRGGTEEEHKNLNILNQVFVDTVRATGGNNTERVLLVPTYAASANETAQRALEIPNDTANEKIVVSLHFYEPWNFALRTGDGSVDTWDVNNNLDTDPIKRYVDLAYEIFVSNGIPVIIGEMGAVNRGNTQARVAWSEFYVSYAASKGIKCIWWDNGSYWVLRRRDWGWEQTFGLLDREKIEIAHPEIVDALMRAAS